MEKIKNIAKVIRNLREFDKSKYKRLYWDCNPEKNKLFLDGKTNGALKMKSLQKQLRTTTLTNTKLKPHLFLPITKDLKKIPPHILQVKTKKKQSLHFLFSSDYH